MALFPVVCLIALSLTSPSFAVDYFLDHSGGQSCDSVCQNHQKICAGTGHGFSPVSALSVLIDLGITCGPDNGTAEYKTKDNPNYVNLELESHDRCNGYDKIPDAINCSYSGSDRVRRLCPCVRGEFYRFQYVQTLLGCSSVAHFMIDGQMYLAFSRLRAFGRYQAGTQIFRLEDNTFFLHQTIKSTYNGPGRARYFQIGSNHYLAVPYFTHSRSSKRSSRTVIFIWIQGYFDGFQELAGGLALATTFIEVGSSKFLAIHGYQALTIYKWNRNRFRKFQVIPLKRAYITECTVFRPDSGVYIACAVWGGNKNSLVFKWNGKKFVLHQKIHGIEYAVTADTVTLGNDDMMLVLAKRQNGYRAKMNVHTPVFLWNKKTSLFESDKSLAINTLGASACRAFKISNEVYLVVAQSADKKSLIYKYKNGKFVKFQELRAAFADDATFFTYKRIHYLVLATRNMGYSPAFTWN